MTKSRNDCHSERESYFAFCTVASACMAHLSNQSAKTAVVANIHQERNNSVGKGFKRSKCGISLSARCEKIFFLRRLLVFVILLQPIRQQWKCRHERLSSIVSVPRPLRVHQLGLNEPLNGVFVTRFFFAFIDIWKANRV